MADINAQRTAACIGERSGDCQWIFDKKNVRQAAHIKMQHNELNPCTDSKSRDR